MQQKFTDSFDSLQQRTIPDWFRDAKFGIWSHWGPQSVAMYGDWYARNMYIEGTPQYEYHLRHYGHPSKFGYKDLCALWKAENFDPEGLMEKYYKAGACYFMSQGSHHDHFFNYDSQLNRMNSVNVGPHKDILAQWKAAADKFRMPFGISEHLGASFSWWRVNKGCDKFGPYAGVPYDGNDPAYRDFYYDNAYLGAEKPLDLNLIPWYTDNAAFRDYWLRCVKEMIDKFHPDLLYTDGSLPFGGQLWQGASDEILTQDYAQGLQAVAHLYNTSIEQHGIEFEFHGFLLQIRVFQIDDTCLGMQCFTSQTAVAFTHALYVQRLFHLSFQPIIFARYSFGVHPARFLNRRHRCCGYWNPRE